MLLPQKPHFPAFTLIFILTLAGCANIRPKVSQKTMPAFKNTYIKQQGTLNSEGIFLLTQQAPDKNYGYSSNNPIMVGGIKEEKGVEYQRAFLNALNGPNGEKVFFRRLGSCCPFITPNGLIDNTGLLDIYEVDYIGSKEPVKIYINFYDYGKLYIPVGFTASTSK